LKLQAHDHSTTNSESLLRIFRVR